METSVEQRKERRTDLAWPVSVWLPEASRFFNGRSANISKVGAFITVPMTTPVRRGSVVELNFPRSREGRSSGSIARPPWTMLPSGWASPSSEAGRVGDGSLIKTDGDPRSLTTGQ